MHAFCNNLSGLPVARGSQFVDSKSVIPFAERLEACGVGGPVGGEGARADRSDHPHAVERTMA